MTSPNSAALARSRRAGAGPAGAIAPPVATRRTVAVVTHDDALADTLRRATPARSVMVVATPAALADLLLQEHSAVLVLDAAVPGSHCARLVGHLALQFPELMMIAVGSRDDEAALGAALADGRLFRFMHRPYSLARARTFVEAALERYDGLQAAPREERIRRITVAGFAVAAALLVAALVPAFRTPAPASPPAASAAPRAAVSPAATAPQVTTHRSVGSARAAGAQAAPPAPPAASRAPVVPRPAPEPAQDVPVAAPVAPEPPAPPATESADTPF